MRFSRQAFLVAVTVAAGVMFQGRAMAAPADGEAALAPIKVAGARWIELSPVLVAATTFYPQKLEVPSGGVVSITSGAADLATNAETQLLRESVTNPDLRTLPAAMFNFVGENASDYAMAATSLVAAMLPLLILYLVLSERFIEGLTAGAIKG